MVRRSVRLTPSSGGDDGFAAVDARERLPQAPAAPEPRLFDVDEYYHMAEAGILRPGERVELIEGVIIKMAAIGGPHASTVDLLAEAFVQRLQGRAHVRVQNPVRFSSYLEPEPDLALLHARQDRYREGHPSAAEIYLIIEVSASSLDYDQRHKLPLYAREGIPETWIVDLIHQRMEVYRSPVDGAYRESATYERGRILSPSAFPDIMIRVDEVLGYE